MPNPTLPSWVTQEPVYVTLVNHNPDSVITTILVERSMNRIPRTSLYQPVAFVLTYSDDGVIRANGVPLELEEEYVTRLCTMSDEARWAVGDNLGHGYYSDPYAS